MRRVGGLGAAEARERERKRENSCHQKILHADTVLTRVGVVTGEGECKEVSLARTAGENVAVLL